MTGADESARPGGPWTERGEVAVPNGSLAYVAAGSGPPVVVLHKLGGWIGDWRRIAGPLAGRFRLVAFDLPGHGDSRVADPSGWEYPLDRLAGDVVAAMDGLRLGGASLVGNSLAGCAAMSIAVARPERIERLVLISVSMGPAISV